MAEPSLFFLSANPLPHGQRYMAYLKARSWGHRYLCFTRPTLARSSSNIVWVITAMQMIISLLVLQTTWMCSFKIQNDNVHWVDRRMDVNQSTHIESIQVGVHVVCFATPNAPYWQISFCSPRWLSECVIITSQPEGIFWWEYVHDRTCESFGAFSCFNRLHRISFIRRSLTTTVATCLVNSFVIARVDYCNSILARLPKYQLSRIQSVLNVAVRIVYGQACFEHITPTLRDRLHWLRVPQRIDFKWCLLVFKVLHGLAPDYIKHYCVEVSSRRCLRSSSHRRLVIPPPAKTVLFGERSFMVEGPSLWNHLPDNVKEAGSIELFKQRLKTHLFRQSFEIPAFS